MVHRSRDDSGFLRQGREPRFARGDAAVARRRLQGENALDSDGREVRKKRLGKGAVDHASARHGHPSRHARSAHETGKAARERADEPGRGAGPVGFGEEPFKNRQRIEDAVLDAHGIVPKGRFVRFFGFRFEKHRGARFVVLHGDEPEKGRGRIEEPAR